MVVSKEQLLLSDAKNNMATTPTTTANINETMYRTLIQAKHQNRVIIGLTAAIQQLSESPAEALFCVLAQPDIGDSATHMHEVLLEAYCYEHDIYIIKVDNSQKLSRLMGTSHIEPCALIQKTGTNCDHGRDGAADNILNDIGQQLSDDEDTLVDYCEHYWDTPAKQPIIQLPES